MNERKDLQIALAGSLEVEVSTIQVVVGGYDKSIRRTERALVLVALPKMISYCASVFCGAQLEEKDEIVDECTDFVLSQFPQLGVPEIREAFKLAAAGKLGEIDLAAYRGVFTIKMLGQVLSKYCTFREKAYQEIRKAETEAQEAQEAARKDADAAASAERMNKFAFEKLAFHLENGCNDSELLAVPLYDFLEQNNLVDLSREEKLVYMERAIPVVRFGFIQGLAAENNEFRKRGIRSTIQDIDKGILSDLVKARQKWAAKQLVISDFVNSYRAVISFFTSLLNEYHNANAA